MEGFQIMQTSKSRHFLVLAILATILNSARSQDCNITYSDLSGTITSPNYPSNYSNGLDCFYIIQSSSQQSINITFQSFETELCCDWVQIRCSIGPAKMSPKYYGTRMPPFLSLDSCSQLILQFHSDVSIVGKGFSLRYTIGSGITGGFITKPSNFFSRQDTIILSCASNAVQPNSYPWWSYSTDGIIFTMLTDYYCNLIYYPSGAIYSTQRVSTSSACNLIIQSATTYASVAVFTCTDSKLNNASAIVTYSDIATPIFTTNISSSLMEVVREDIFSITCSVLPLLNPNQILQIQSSLYLTSSTPGIGYYFNASLSITITAQPDILPSYTWSFDVLSKLSFDIATNRPMLNSLSFTTESRPVLYWPENNNMIITGDLNGIIDSNGSLVCYVPANPSATYLWRDENLGLTTTGSVIYVTRSGTYTCNATNYIRGKMYQASKSKAITVTEKAPSRDCVTVTNGEKVTVANAEQLNLVALIVGVVLGAAVLILLLLVIIAFTCLCRERQNKASRTERTVDGHINNGTENQYEMPESPYVNQSEIATSSGGNPRHNIAMDKEESDSYEKLQNSFPKKNKKP